MANARAPSTRTVRPKSCAGGAAPSCPNVSELQLSLKHSLSGRVSLVEGRPYQSATIVRASLVCEAAL